MKKIIRLTETDLTRIVKRVIKEQSSPVRIGCRDYDKIGQLCSTLVFPKDEADKLISKFKPNADKEASERINALVQSLTSMGGEEGKRIAQKFSEAISSTKGQIQKILTKYYSQAMYASCGLGPKLNEDAIMLKICGVIYSQFITSWNDSFFMRNVASLAINKNNIKEVQSEGKDILSSVIDDIESCVYWYFQFSTFDHIIDRVRELEKTSPKCTKVIVIQDRGCNDLPKEKWYNPTQKYKNIDSPLIYTNAKQLAMNTYSPKLVEFLNNLV